MTSYQQPPATGADPSLKEKATEAVGQSKQAAGQVAQSATEHVQEVKQEAVRQARDLAGEARQRVTRQAGDQSQNLVTNLRSLSSELGSMVERSEQSGTATELVSQARERLDGVANWLDGREPSDLLEEVRNFARRRPGTFLLGALAAGVVAGRLTRGAVAARSADQASATTAVMEPSGGYAHTTGQAGYEQTGYAMGGTYVPPAAGERPPGERGYGATSPYGETGSEPYPAAGYQNEPQR